MKEVVLMKGLLSNFGRGAPAGTLRVYVQKDPFVNYARCSAVLIST